MLWERIRPLPPHDPQVGFEFSWDIGQGVALGSCRDMPYYPCIRVLGHSFVPGELKLILLVLRAGFLAPGTVEPYFFRFPDSLRGVLGYPPEG